MGRIYLLTSPSGKKYVGQTRGSVEARMKHHAYSAYNRNGRGCPALNCAIRKYGGILAFKLEILLECSNDELDAHEIRFIAEHQSLRPRGYNISTGGGGRGSVRPKVDRDEIHARYVATIPPRIIPSIITEEVIGRLRAEQRLGFQAVEKMKVFEKYRLPERMTKSIRESKGERGYGQYGFVIKLSKEDSSYTFLSSDKNDLDKMYAMAVDCYIILKSNRPYRKSAEKYKYETDEIPRPMWIVPYGPYGFAFQKQGFPKTPFDCRTKNRRQNFIDCAAYWLEKVSREENEDEWVFCNECIDQMRVLQQEQDDAEDIHDDGTTEDEVVNYNNFDKEDKTYNSDDETITDKNKVTDNNDNNKQQNNNL